MTRPPVLAVTPGEPAGIGPDICLALAQHPPDATLVLIADPAVLKERARLLGLPLELKNWPAGKTNARGVFILPIATAQAVTPGALDKANGAYVMESLERATAGCLSREFSALVTAPVHKGILNDAGFSFSGHTEFLARASGAPLAIMMLSCPGLRVALATTHLPLADVSRHITVAHLTTVIEIVQRDLKVKFGIENPRLLVCGLNPHAGESGHLGREEIDVIEPVIQKLMARGMRLTGPVPADTAFIRSQLSQVDAVLAMYHDQGLPVIKHRDFEHAVNITLGLPFVRTSVDHGTALALAGTGRADSSSLRAAVDTALSLIR